MSAYRINALGTPGNLAEQLSQFTPNRPVQPQAVQHRRIHQLRLDRRWRISASFTGQPTMARIPGLVGSAGLPSKGKNQKQNSRANEQVIRRPSPGILNRGLELQLDDAF
jgi:hypothetical protein